jgi:sucrose-6-phosphate hydrolase SacC (GH32 family)
MLNRALCLILLLCFCGVCRAADILISDFSGASYGSWTATGTAFDEGLASASRFPKLALENALDDAVVCSEIDGDAPKGTLTSPVFTVKRNYISFRIAGGDYEQSTCVNLLIGGKVVKSATGWRSDRLAPESWEVKPFIGREAQIQIVDDASGDWGHVNVDHIVQTDKPERLSLAPGPLYQEALRPQFHFTARQWTMNRLHPKERQEGWINDLNGLIYYEGEYHLFAQRWAKCWLHAVSRDLVHWTELEPAFWEESLESGVQSGHCVIDYDNTSGLGKDPLHPPMVAFWSRFDNRTQCLCYSLDHGRSWTRYAKNPLMIEPERDPKVFWYAPGHHWVMLLYGNEQYRIFTSTNLLAWHDENNPIPHGFECPDFFQLPLDGDTNARKWVLIQGNGNYSIGTFDGHRFTEETPRFPCDVGPNFYATQTWGNTETGDGRRIQVAWMREPPFPDMPFNQQISFPCELTLHRTPAGPRVFREPIKEIALLHEGEDEWKERELRPNEILPLAPSGELFQIKGEVSIPDNARLVLTIRGNRVVLSAKTVESGHAPAAVMDRLHEFEILVDRASIETFVNHGEISSTRFVLPQEEGVSLKAEGGAVQLKWLTVYPLKSAWPAAPAE